MTHVKLCECGCGEPAPISPITYKKWGYVKGQPRRFCKGHYLKLYPLRYERTGPSPEERFWKFVRKTDGCWIWTGARTGNGYGAFGFNNKLEGAHRVAWIFANGEIPEGLLIRHKCDNPICVRADHLELGSATDNSRDMIKRGRNKPILEGIKKRNFRGERNPSAKLTKFKVTQIRNTFAAEKATIKELALEYGVTGTCIRDIIRKKTWKHLE